VLLGVVVVREMLQLLVSLKRYLASRENWIEIIMIGKHVSLMSLDLNINNNYFVSNLAWLV
jgi:hypothetical protein